MMSEIKIEWKLFSTTTAITPVTLHGKTAKRESIFIFGLWIFLKHWMIPEYFGMTKIISEYFQINKWHFGVSALENCRIKRFDDFICTCVITYKQNVRSTCPKIEFISNFCFPFYNSRVQCSSAHMRFSKTFR